MMLVLGMTSAMAATITITRDSTYDGVNTGARTYTAYKVLDADTTLSGSNSQSDKDPTYTSNGPIAYTILKTSPWVTAVQGATTWFDVKDLPGDSTRYSVTLKSGVTNNATTAQAIAAYFNSNIPNNAPTVTITPPTAVTVDPGYYLIVPSDGAPNLTLVTTDVTIVEKNPYVTTHKTGPETSFNVGDIIPYTATVIIPADTSKNGPITLHDTMTANVLAFQNDVAATIDTDTDNDGNNDAFTGFTVKSTGLTDDCTFEISIPVTDDVLGKTITFTYSAMLTDAAATDTGYVNELFGEKNGYTTKPEDVTDWTFDFSFLKDFTGVNDPTLTAKFELQTNTHTDASGDDPATDAPSGTAIKFNAKDGHKYEKSDDNTGTTELVIADAETLNIVGLKEGIYWLVEKETSTGYNLLDGPVKVIITDTSTQNQSTGVWTVSHTVTTVGNNIDQNGVITVENNSGTVLPSTGGMGTTILYVGGSILVILAAILLVTKRRMGSND